MSQTKLGRPRKQKSAVRNAVLHIYVTHQEKEWLYQEASRLNQDASSFCRNILVAATDKRVQRQKQKQQKSSKPDTQKPHPAE